MSDYEYSDSFISDEDDAPRVNKSTGGRNVRRYKPGKSHRLWNVLGKTIAR